MPQRHLVETRFGAVVMVFPIAHQSGWGPGLTRLYNRIVTASLIGDQAPLPDCGRPARTTDDPQPPSPLQAPRDQPSVRRQRMEPAAQLVSPQSRWRAVGLPAPTPVRHRAGGHTEPRRGGTRRGRRGRPRLTRRGSGRGATALTVVSRAAAASAHWRDAAGPALLGALRPADGPEAERQILATLTVVFAEQIKGPPSEEDFRVLVRNRPSSRPTQGSRSPTRPP